MSESQESSGAFRAQTIELFFDLVFVFTITQITHLVEHAHGAIDLLHAFAVLMLVWWMYGGYIWLTNHAHTPKSMRLVLIAAMAGFLVMALSIPESDGAGRLVFGLAYLFIVVLHFLAFVWQGGAPAARAMLRIVPFNLLAALMVIAAGLIEAEWSWVLLLAPAGLYLIVALFNTGTGFALDVGHFVERHGLLLIIVLGEIIIAVGTGLAEAPTQLGSLAALVLAIGLIAAVWWSYFDGDDARAERIMQAGDNRRRTRIALFGYGGAHLLMIAGLILTAAGLKVAVAAAGHAGEAAAHGNDGLLLFGMALYLAGDGLFRALLGIRPFWPRPASAALLGLAALLHAPLHATALVAVVLAVLVATLTGEAALRRASAA